MDKHIKNERYALVAEAEKKVIEEMTSKIFYMLGSNQRLQLIQDKLPTKPLYSVEKIRDILKENGK